jgi:hypothetical protein
MFLEVPSVLDGNARQRENHFVRQISQMNGGYRIM